MKKKVAIISGSGKGIGKSLARAFALKKYHVVIAEIDQESGRETMDELLEAGESARFIKTDVSKVSDIENMVTKTIEQFGRIDVLINNAGLSEFTNIFEMNEEQWDRVLNTNLKSVFFASREVARHMKEKGGSIINIASTRAIMSEPNSEAYAASKGGILGLTHALAASLSEHRITVNAILPGWIANENYDQLRPKDHDQHFSKRVGKPEDIARACLFLAEAQNNFITGSQLVIDGGMTRKMIYE